MTGPAQNADWPDAAGRQYCRVLIGVHRIARTPEAGSTAIPGGNVLHMFGFSGCAIIVRHWLEIDLADAEMEHGARVEVRELAVHPHRGSESAAQLIAADRPLWRADLFDRLSDQPGTFAAAHYHPFFVGDEPSDRTWDKALTADPWNWLGEQITSLGSSSGDEPWRLDAADAVDVPRRADQIVAAARGLAPDHCRSAEECFQLTQDVRDTVRLMIDYLERPDLLDMTRVRPWTEDS
jgi:hypothetical protein